MASSALLRDAIAERTQCTWRLSRFQHQKNFKAVKHLLAFAMMRKHHTRYRDSGDGTRLSVGTIVAATGARCQQEPILAVKSTKNSGIYNKNLSLDLSLTNRGPRNK